jgi:hypothetical protein
MLYKLVLIVSTFEYVLSSFEPSLGNLSGTNTIAYFISSSMTKKHGTKENKNKQKIKKTLNKIGTIIAANFE